MVTPLVRRLVTVMTTANAMTQLNADPSMRGRIVSVHLLVVLGGTPIGAPLVGLVSDTLGARFSLIPGGAISALAAISLSAVVTARSRTTQESTPLPGRLQRPSPCARGRRSETGFERACPVRSAQWGVNEQKPRQATT
ncbi:hypothetical protein [Streptomyces sp. NPDC053069]|uniref:hypothetical protein n=1 Tax=Streptomyces sp. NPDC053069 TaxID=3365695 RepID=UPI0037D7E52F